MYTLNFPFRGTESRSVPGWITRSNCHIFTRYTILCNWQESVRPIFTNRINVVRVKAGVPITYKKVLSKIVKICFFVVPYHAVRFVQTSQLHSVANLVPVAADAPSDVTSPQYFSFFFGVKWTYLSTSEHFMSCKEDSATKYIYQSARHFHVVPLFLRFSGFFCIYQNKPPFNDLPIQSNWIMAHRWDVKLRGPDSFTLYKLYMFIIEI